MGRTSLNQIYRPAEAGLSHDFQLPPPAPAEDTQVLCAHGDPTPTAAGGCCALHTTIRGLEVK